MDKPEGIQVRDLVKMLLDLPQDAYLVISRYSDTCLYDGEPHTFAGRRRKDGEWITRSTGYKNEPLPATDSDRPEIETFIHLGC